MGGGEESFETFQDLRGLIKMDIGILEGDF